MPSVGNLMMRTGKSRAFFVFSLDGRGLSRVRIDCYDTTARRDVPCLPRLEKRITTRTTSPLLLVLDAVA